MSTAPGHSQTPEAGGAEPSCTWLNRRQFLFYGAGATASVVALAAIPGSVAVAETAVLSRYPRKRLLVLGDLAEGIPVHFKYPSDDPFASASFIVKLGVRAGGGIGPDSDVVAFNGLCPHMGGPLMGTYKPEHHAIGPCPFHLSTFDLTKHGMVIAGHATESLPQILLEVDGGDVYATGVLGLLYGLHDNTPA